MAESTTNPEVEVVEMDHALGPATAPVTLIEYGDYECPDCLNAFPIVQKLRERFGQSLRFVFRHFPQHSIHAHASVAAQASEAAGFQGKFWLMHEALFRNQQRLGEIDFGNLALKLGMELYGFESDLYADRTIQRVRQQQADAERSGVRKTPTFFINGRRYDGPADLDSLASAIDRALGT